MQTVRVLGDGDSVTLDDATVRAGLIRFELSTTNPTDATGGGGSGIQLFRLEPGVTLERYFADLAKQFSEVATDRAASAGLGAAGHLPPHRPGRLPERHAAGRDPRGHRRGRRER